MKQNKSISYFVGDGKDLQKKKKAISKSHDVSTMPGTRFRFQGQGKPKVEDPKGDSCLWAVNFEVLPVALKPKYYLLLQINLPCILFVVHIDTTCVSGMLCRNLRSLIFGQSNHPINHNFSFSYLFFYIPNHHEINDLSDFYLSKLWGSLQEPLTHSKSFPISMNPHLFQIQEFL